MPGAVVGEFFRKKAVRAPINPLDKATIVSVLPKEIDEKKPTLTPARWVIPPGAPEKPSIVVVGPSSWWREIDEEQPLLEIPVSSIIIAESVVKDYCNGIVGCNMDDSMPGLFYVPGAKVKDIRNPTTGQVETVADIPATYEWIMKDYKKAIENAVGRQKNWYSALVKMGDSLWARSNGNPLAISDDMRLAARELGLQETKDWMKEFRMVEMARCFACGSLRNPQYPVCQTCKAIDPNHPHAKDIKFAL